MAINPKQPHDRPGATQPFQSLIGGQRGTAKFVNLLAAKEKHAPNTTSTYAKTSEQDQATKEVAKAPTQQINRLWNKV